jgi:hypothetical protein
MGSIRTRLSAAGFLLQEVLQALFRLPSAFVGCPNTLVRILLDNTRLFRQNVGLLSCPADFVFYSMSLPE